MSLEDRWERQNDLHLYALKMRLAQILPSEVGMCKFKIESSIHGNRGVDNTNDNNVKALVATAL